MAKPRTTPAILPGFVSLEHARHRDREGGMVRLEVTITPHDHSRLERYCDAAGRSKRSAIRYALRRHLEEWEALDG